MSEIKSSLGEINVYKNIADENNLNIWQEKISQVKHMKNKTLGNKINTASVIDPLHSFRILRLSVGRVNSTKHLPLFNCH